VRTGRPEGDGEQALRVFTMRLLLADDQPLIRTGFRMILEETGDIDIVGEAQDGASAVRLAAELNPDVILMDVRMPGVDGIEATRQIVARNPAARVLILTTFDLDDQLTPREQEVLLAVATGLSNTEIAEKLTVSETTVKTHVGSILAKLGLRNRVQAVIFAYDAGLTR
jgi:DNA-binding NarL/FixJ family response regulator